MLESKGCTGTIQTRSSHISEKIWQSIHPRKIRLWRKRTTERRPYRLWRGETQSGVSPSVGPACCSVAPWLRKFGSIHLRNVGTTSCKNVETLPLKNNLSRFKSLPPSSLPFKVAPASFEHDLVLLATLPRGGGGITSTRSWTGHLYQSTVHPFPAPTTLAHALIISPSPSWPCWPSQKCL